jgi:hypothetical protein
MEHPRIVASNKVKGGFFLPLGLRLFDRPRAEPNPEVLVSTVLLDGAHLEDSLGIVDAETGYETMVFIEGCSFFSLYTQHYETRADAEAGHHSVLTRLRDKTLPLTIVMDNYYVANDGLPERAERAASPTEGPES